MKRILIFAVLSAPSIFCMEELKHFFHQDPNSSLKTEAGIMLALFLEKKEHNKKTFIGFAEKVALICPNGYYTFTGNPEWMIKELAQPRENQKVYRLINDSQGRVNTFSFSQEASFSVQQKFKVVLGRDSSVVAGFPIEAIDFENATVVSFPSLELNSDCKKHYFNIIKQECSNAGFIGLE